MSFLRSLTARYQSHKRLSVILGAIIVFALVLAIGAAKGKYEKRVLNNERAWFASNSLIDPKQTGQFAQPSINVLCLDQCSSVHGLYRTSRATQSIDQARESLAEYTRERGYSLSSNSCNSQRSYKAPNGLKQSCRVAGKKGKVQPLNIEFTITEAIENSGLSNVPILGVYNITLSIRY